MDDSVDFSLAVMFSLLVGILFGVWIGRVTIHVESSWPALCQTATAVAQKTPEIPR